MLITSASRKVALVRAFREAVAREGGGRVVACDASPLSPALYHADVGLVAPPLDEPGGEEWLLAVCRRHGVRLLVPTRDQELPWFAARRESFAAAGTTVLVPSPETVEVCQDKVLFVRRCGEWGFATPRSWLPPLPPLEDLPYPLFLRPRRGRGSSGAGAVASAAELAGRLAGDEEGWLAQERVTADELTVDLAADLAGRVLSVVPRLRIATVGGESFVGRTVADEAVREQAAALALRLGLLGHATIQCFRTADEVLFIEVNSRFGGGAALGFAAGAHTPHLLLRVVLGREVEPLGYAPGLTMLRYTEDLFLRPGDLLEPRP